MPTNSPSRSALATSSSLPFAGFGYAGSSRSALEVGGDYCELIPWSDTSLLMVMADVMGKGRPASLFADSLRMAVRALANPGVRPSVLLTEINQVMFEQLSSADLFITVQVATADLGRRQLRVANAGHCPLLISDGRNRMRAIAPSGIPLGIQMDAAFGEESVKLEPSASVLLYTDGVTEARSPAGKFFGQQRLESWFHQGVGADLSAIELKGSLLKKLASFQKSDRVSDDQTFLILSDETPRLTALPASENLRWFLPWSHSRSSPAWSATPR